MNERSLARDAALVAIVHALGCAAVLALGFDHVSDDDFSRVTIAQSFVHAPKLDPSGTSWLPFPFWTLGLAMAAFGRTLAIARGASIILASLAATLPYVALRTARVPRQRALVAVAFGLLSPWSLWLGAATVPESFTASSTAAAAIALGATPPADDGAPSAPPSRWAQVGFALAMLAACLSRYEAWPVAAVLAVVLVRRAARDRRTHQAASKHRFSLAAIVAFGPLAWMAWNLHAHADALHFFVRVTRFKRALGDGTPSTADALLLYPTLFVKMRPDVIVAVVAAVVLVWRAKTSRLVGREVAARWLVPMACVGAQLAFLAYGSARDGAPAHHSERALLAAAFLGAAFAADALLLAFGAAAERSRSVARAAVALAATCWLFASSLGLRIVPGRTEAEDRSAQTAAGNQLRKDGAERVQVTPCAYEHFALVAAFGAPERVDTRPRTGAPVTTSCPAVERR